jgi:hypothetical protein
VQGCTYGCDSHPVPVTLPFSTSASAMSLISTLSPRVLPPPVPRRHQRRHHQKFLSRPGNMQRRLYYPASLGTRHMGRRGHRLKREDAHWKADPVCAHICLYLIVMFTGRCVFSTAPTVCLFHCPPIPFFFNEEARLGAVPCYRRRSIL